MAKYGSFLYGTERYGAPSYVVKFDANPFYALPFQPDYSSDDANTLRQLALKWTNPAGYWTRLRLVRNAYGWPLHEDDGLGLLDRACGPAVLAPDAALDSYIDSRLQPGRFFYYTVFVQALDTALMGPEPYPTPVLYDPAATYHAASTSAADQVYYGDVLYVPLATVTGVAPDSDPAKWSPVATEWIRAGNTTALTVGKYNYTERMLDILPEPYWVDVGDPSGRNDQLVRYLSILGYQFDILRTEYDTLRWAYNPDRVAASLLLPLGDQFGVSYDPEMGIRQYRSMVRNAVFINKRKGTRAGTNQLISSFTGWDADISIGRNLMLDFNDSSFEQWTGQWTRTNGCTVRWRGHDIVVDAASTANVTRYGEQAIDGIYTAASLVLLKNQLDPTENGVYRTDPRDWRRETVTTADAFRIGSSAWVSGGTANGSHRWVLTGLDTARWLPDESSTTWTLDSTAASASEIAPWTSLVEENLTEGMLEMVATAAGTITAGCRHANIPSSAIPVTAGTAYTLSAYFRPVTVGRASTCSVVWHDLHGTWISTNHGSFGTTSVLHDWTRVATTATAPAGAAWATPWVEISGVAGAGERHVVDAVQFEVGSSATDYQEARDIRIALHAERVNEIPNPSAEVNTTGWSGTGATLARDATVAHRLRKVAAWAGVPNEDPNAVADTVTAPINQPGARNLASFLLTATGNAPGSAVTLSGTSAMPVVGGDDYELSCYALGAIPVHVGITWLDSTGAALSTVSGVAATQVTGHWNRPYLVATAPDAAYYAQAVITGAFTTTGQAVHFDQVMLERSAEGRTFIDPDNFGSRSADYLWEGTAHNSRTHFYFDRGSKIIRLQQLLPSYLGPGNTFTLLFAQPFIRPTFPPNEQVQNIFGDFTAAASLTVSADTNGLYDPRATTGLQLWLDSRYVHGFSGVNPATSVAVAQWNDLSSNLRHAYQATGADQPLMGTTGSRPVVVFDATNDYLLANDTLSGARTVYVVATPGGSVASTRTVAPNLALTSAGNWSVVDGAATATIAASVGRVDVLSLTVPATGAATMRLNGSGTVTTSASTAVDTSYYVGGDNTAGSGVKVLAALVYTGVHDAATRQGIERWLGTAYGVTVA